MKPKFYVIIVVILLFTTITTIITTIITTYVGIVVFKETYDITKLACLTMIVLGVVGLNLAENH